MNHRSLRPSARYGLLPSAIAAALVSALVPAIAGAQEADASNQATTTLDRIEVTGSRIRQANLETSQPVVTMTRAEIQKQGFTSIADIVQNITATGSPAISRADALASGEDVGGQYVDLRNLGPQRTLVLIDGKRMGISSSGYSDLAAIPSSIVERIEVLTDGASALYGSDAIAGVVNIITRKRFDGLEGSAYLGQYGQGDGTKEVYNFVIGQTGERGSVTLGAEYSKEDPVFARDRSFTASPQGRAHPTPDLGGPEGSVRSNGWSGINQWGTLFDADGNAFTANRGTTNTKDINNFHPTNGLTDQANANQQMYLSTGLERRSVFANAEFDITDNVRAKADVLYTDREATQQIAGYPFRSTGFSDRYDGDLSLKGDSAFNPLGYDANFFRRGWEVPRQTKSELTTYRFSGGLEGSFEFAGKPWDWDVGYLYNQNKGVKTGTGNLFLPNVEKALGPSFVDASGVARCGTEANPIAGCYAWNPLLGPDVNAPGSLNNKDLQKFLYLPTHDTSTTKTQVYSLNLSGVLATLPAGDLGIAAGYEHRKEEAHYSPDALLQSGLSTDLAGSETQGGYSLDEFYVELAVPVLSDVAFAKELSFNIAGRYSDYNTFGDTTNGKFSLKWKPIDDLLIRGTYATGFRAPTVADLYGGISESFDNYTDPCDTLFGSAVRNPQVATRCGAGGVPAGFRQVASGGKPATGPNAQSDSSFLSGSNPNLLPETSKSTTVGFVYSPSWFNGFDISLDWWKIKIDDVIAAETVSSILNNCYVLGIDSACGRFIRDTDPDNLGQVVGVTRNLINAGYQETAGYDLGISYRLADTRYGNFAFTWKTTYVDYLEYKRDNESTTPVEQRSSWVADGASNFRVRSNFNADWSWGDFGASWGIRYYSGLKEECSYDLNGGAECDKPDYRSAYKGAVPVREVGANTFHDVQVRYNTPWNATVSLGANNVFDHIGQTMYSQPNSSFSYNGSFDIGRFVYMKYTQRF
ncbi:MULTISPECIES: TonB-dependent receptor plug domain-containing protein [Lysobacter]|jgi:iron complex outermembrane receptor protein|uniref:TonB-dependent receptor n=1 Tax=Lysobacter gummosus TaxID=262324 RepID=A0ABY3XFR1_9GAMM|nr:MULTISPECIES: TonB-dependent receptor [Lysobacter]ALN89872.1 tonB dependent receptor family protein [Lysobacter gummosus]UJB18252.1 TonB-dependent receptor [Lysobacter capsici]UJQ28025.1 TonB-dependent receptor [Lysobacter gummosus]UNP30467.1 TonB-dependent receptor [Lysobacter gummosus]